MLRFVQDRLVGRPAAHFLSWYRPLSLKPYIYIIKNNDMKWAPFVPNYNKDVLENLL